MATDISASPIQIPQVKKALTGAERQRRYKAKLRAAKIANLPAVTPSPAPVTPSPVVEILPPEPQKRKGFRISPAQIALRLAAIALGGVGLAMNGKYAMSLGSNEGASWLLLALGLATDCAALALPSVAARSWQDGQRGSAMAAWAVWATCFAFALLAGLGFASASIADVTLQRASRQTPAVTAASLALSDAMRSRDAECKSGTGRYCRDRESEVTLRRAALDKAMGEVQAASDPQTMAATSLVRWVSRGGVTPSPDDIGMLRLLLLCLLPQAGGVMLMVSRRAVARTGTQSAGWAG